jgi:hypothetical protein
MHRLEHRPSQVVLTRTPTRRGWLLASPVLAIAFVPLFANWQYVSRRGDTTARDFAHDLLISVERSAVVVTAGDNDTFPLWYAQHVEGIRKDVVIAVASLLTTDWYARQMVRAPGERLRRGARAGDGWRWMAGQTRLNPARPRLG